MKVKSKAIAHFFPKCDHTSFSKMRSPLSSPKCDFYDQLPFLPKVRSGYARL
ncbi:hypothetical protein [Planktothrix agardhii]|uniref:hypothetical protein n=1 Tax=Planktothrix agardhii TaxID=1160 RepID=UPI001F2D20F5|nr:hypothetical protein [Planktothrix agardhii]MCF3574171.1 hypothetical protein [Planktothrix agardhii 1812]MCF3574392.1 hypothetical protein [Planktothrix agardhii 1812]